MMDISLDPSALGLGEFSKQVGDIRNRSNRVAQWLSAIIAEKRKAQRRRDAAKVAYDEALQFILATDPDVRGVDGQQAKMAEARAKLGKEARIVAFANQIYTIVLGYHEALKLVHDQLSETSHDLMRQYSVIKQQMRLGEVDPQGFRSGHSSYSIPEGATAELEAKLAQELGDAGSVDI